MEVTTFSNSIFEQVDPKTKIPIFLIEKLRKEVGGCSREKAVAALLKHRGDMLEAVFDILFEGEDSGGR
jgi:hypothetical protein